jgi:TPR repeat protein
MKMLRIAVLAAAALVAWTSALAYTSREEKDGEGVVVSGAIGPADLKRGKEAAAQGRVDDARRDLEPLAERGYFDAQLALGRLYLQMQDASYVPQAIEWLRRASKKEFDIAAVPLARALVREGSEASLDEAEPLLEQAWRRTSDPDALAGLIRLYSEHPQRDDGNKLHALAKEAERTRHPEPRMALISYYRNNPAPENRAKLVALCNDNLDLVPECYVVLAQEARAKGDKKALRKLADGAIAQYRRGRVPAATTATLARAMVETTEEFQEKGVQVSDLPEVDAAEMAPSPTATPVAAAPASPPPAIGAGCNSPPLVPTKAAQEVSAAPDGGAPDLANELLMRMAKGSSEGPLLAAGVVVRYPYLAPDFEVEPTLKTQAQGNNSVADLYLGELYFNGQRAIRNPKAALAHLQKAARNPGTELEAHYYLGRLYQSGFLDEVDGERALKHLLHAARRGYVRADGQIARFYSQGKGVCPDLVLAYVFATLGSRDGTPSIAALKQQLESTLNPQQRAQAREILQREVAARPRELQNGAALQAALKNNQQNVSEGGQP